MSGNRCPAREYEVEVMLRDSGPLSLSEIAERLGVKPATASNYTQSLRKDGRAHNTGIGCKAMWYAGPESSTGSGAIVQAASVWEYAARMR